MHNRTADEQLSPHFALSEFTVSKEAVRLGLDNTPPPALLPNLRRLAHKLEELRTALGQVPVLVLSGYRCPALNVAVRGAENSAHMLGLAADVMAPGYGSPAAVCRRLLEAGLLFDQLVYEHQWLHLGLSPYGVAPRREVFTAVFNTGQRTRYVPGLLE